MRIGSLFAGIGGFDLGLEQAGHETAWQVELDEKCRLVLERHFPRAERFADIRECGAANLKPVDVVCGGFPCQDLSVAGRRAGLAGERSGLFHEMVRIVDELRPVWLVWENVPGLLSSHGGRDFGTVLLELDRIGYGGAWTLLDARYFGLAQRRRRIFGVFTRLDSGAERTAEVLALAARVRGNPPPRSEARAGAATASLCGLGSGGADDNDGQAGQLAATVRSNMRNNSGGGKLNADKQTFVGALHTASGRASTTTEDGNQLVAHTVTSKWAKGSGGPAGSEEGNLAVVGAQQGGGDADPPCSTRAAHDPTPTGVRRLTPTECERLQGFPDGWTDGWRVPVTPEYIAECARKGQVPEEYVLKRFADSHRYRMLGNAVATPCARWIGRRLPEGDAHE